MNELGIFFINKLNEVLVSLIIGAILGIPLVIYIKKNYRIKEAQK